MSTSLDIIIADDHTIVIEGLKLLLKNEQNIVIVDVANSGKELLDLLKKQLPKVVLLDINMPGLNGLETARHIKQSYSSVKVIMLSTYNEEHLIEKARQYGADGYLLKNCNKEELLQTIQQVVDGNICFPSNLSDTTNEFNSSDPFLKQFNLSKREVEIIGLIKKGLTNQQMADTLFRSIYTVETHRKNIMQKLQLNSPSALTKFIIENDL